MHRRKYNKIIGVITYGGIQQLRGQEEGEGGSAKIPRLSTQGHSVLNRR